jgi:hypothetical protein
MTVSNVPHLWSLHRAWELTAHSTEGLALNTNAITAVRGRTSGTIGHRLSRESMAVGTNVSRADS